MVQKVSRAYAIQMLLHTENQDPDDGDDVFVMAEDKFDWNSLSNEELTRRLNDEMGYDEDDEDRYEVEGDDDYVTDEQLAVRFG